MCVDIEPEIRTAAAVAWEAVAKISLFALVLSLCSIEGDEAECIAAEPGVAAARAAAAAAAAATAAGVATARIGGGPQEAIRPSRWWSRNV